MSSSDHASNDGEHTYIQIRIEYFVKIDYNLQYKSLFATQLGDALHHRADFAGMHTLVHEREGPCRRLVRKYGTDQDGYTRLNRVNIYITNRTVSF